MENTSRSGKRRLPRGSAAGREGRRLQGASADAFLLAAVKMMTVVLGFVVTRLLSQYLSKYDYGTYSKVVLIVSAISSLTILGMMDGVNYFFCSTHDPKRQEQYLSTMFVLQILVSAVAGSLVMLLSHPICDYLDHSDARKLLLFAAALPFLQNILCMTQVLIVTIGKARLLAARNLVVSIVRLTAVVLALKFVRTVWAVLLITVALDLGQIALFLVILRRSGCRFRFQTMRLELVKPILRYTIPMAVSVVLSEWNRNCDKYIVTLFTDTQTLAVYANASKPLPFDLIQTSFTTVLLPAITRLIARGKKREVVSLYQSFLEIVYTSTVVLGCAALSVSPQLMRLLYTEKYLAGLSVFVIYILVDMIKFTNITLLLSASGRTKQLMALAVGALVANLVLNLALFHVLGLIGPAIATLIVTLGTGIAMLHVAAKGLGAGVKAFFDLRYLARLAAESVAAVAAFCFVRTGLEQLNLPYLAVMILTGGACFLVLGALNGKRFARNLRQVNQMSRAIVYQEG